MAVNGVAITAKAAARLRAKYNVRTLDALLVATALDEKAAAFLTNDPRLRRLQAEGINYSLR
jgi:predicted nucleic acid-binding protein